MHSLLAELRSQLTAKPAQTAPEAEVIAVRRADLPLCCPRSHETLWNMHPRVYLPIEDDPKHEVVCPYCGARYRLID
ncbi:zinc-finger domain-containing protein [Caldichromatium japonicum]|uniref:Zinc-finger domain-containing protein n=1 Tax=Caldichromatium japonicum TaxID=2699430 RepID=A0A6G7VCG6_9GAMM|nr:zinc-finger domain-containing protein [Caldichromatium japonicum]QIK37773.1 zinc-finger domain-containing protein [Caldichromatium japonicum]